VKDVHAAAIAAWAGVRGTWNLEPRT
jgi:hypothetical protein